MICTEDPIILIKVQRSLEHKDLKQTLIHNGMVGCSFMLAIKLVIYRELNV